MYIYTHTYYAKYSGLRLGNVGVDAGFDNQAGAFLIFLCDTLHSSLFINISLAFVKILSEAHVHVQCTSSGMTPVAGKWSFKLWRFILPSCILY